MGSFKRPIFVDGSVLFEVVFLRYNQRCLFLPLLSAFFDGHTNFQRLYSRFDDTLRR